MDPRQKHYIMENRGKKSAAELARDLGIRERKVKKFLESVGTPPAAPQPQRSKATPHVYACLLAVLAVTAITYLPSLDNGFTNWDDQVMIRDNPIIKNPTFNTIFGKDYTEAGSEGYVPLTVFSFAVEYHFFKFHPFIYHLDNLLLHLGVVALIYLFGLRLGLSVPASGLGALLFGIHPVHVESVAWITERKDVLYAFFYMLALNSYWQYLQERRKAHYGWAYFGGFLSMLAKPMAFSLPLVLLLCDWFHKRKMTIGVFVEKGLFLLYTVPILWATYSLQGRKPEINPAEAIPIFNWSFIFYIKKFLFPYPLHPYYKLPEPITIVAPAYLAPILATLAILFLLILFRKNRWFVFAFAFYFASIFFLLRVDSLEKNLVADRYMYLPSLGFCLFFSYLVCEILKKIMAARKALFQLGAGLVAMVYATLAVMTLNQCNIWEDGVSLWTKVIKHNPTVASVFSSRGNAYADSGQYDLALADLDEAIRLDPTLAKAYNNRGIVHYTQGRQDEAFADFNKAIELDPNYDYALNSRATIYMNRGQYDQALADYNSAIAINKYYSSAYFNRGLLFKSHNRATLALDSFNHAIRINPIYAKAYHNRGAVYRDKKEYERAMADFQEALRLNPALIAVYYDRGLLYAQRQQYDLAIADFTTALKFIKNDANIYRHRAVAYRAKGNIQKAEEDTVMAESLGYRVGGGNMQEITPPRDANAVNSLGP